MPKKGFSFGQMFSIFMLGTIAITFGPTLFSHRHQLFPASVQAQDIDQWVLITQGDNHWIVCKEKDEVNSWTGGLNFHTEDDRHVNIGGNYITEELGIPCDGKHFPGTAEPDPDPIPGPITPTPNPQPEAKPAPNTGSFHPSKPKGKNLIIAGVERDADYWSALRIAEANGVKIDGN